MIRFGFVILLFNLCGVVSGQEMLLLPSVPPYADEHFAARSELHRSFELPVVEDLDEEDLPAIVEWKTVDNFAFGKNRGGIPMIADINALHPYFREKVISLIQACAEKGIELAVVESYRTKAKQNEYKAMGKKYTRSGGGYSKHQYGLAIDVVPIIDSIAVWHNNALWKKIGVAGEKLGLRWGGRWRHPYDPGHFEWSGGLNSQSLAQGATPGKPGSADETCVQEELARLQQDWVEWENEQALLANSRKAPNKAMK